MKTPPPIDAGLKKAFRAAALHVGHRDEKGGKAALAKALGISKQATSRWRRVPANRVLDVEEITGVTREELRPDLHRRRKHRGSAGFVGRR